MREGYRVNVSILASRMSFVPGKWSQNKMYPGDVFHRRSRLGPRERRYSPSSRGFDGMPSERHTTLEFPAREQQRLTRSPTFWPEGQSLPLPLRPLRSASSWHGGCLSRMVCGGRRPMHAGCNILGAVEPGSENMPVRHGNCLRFKHASNRLHVLFHHLHQIPCGHHFAFASSYRRPRRNRGRGRRCCSHWKT